MKKHEKIFIIVSIILAISILLVAGVGRYLNSAVYYENIYKNEPTTYNLLKLCDFCLEKNDLTYLSYVDLLLSAEDFEQVVGDYFGYDKTKVLNYRNALKLSTMYAAGLNDDIDLFLECADKYYVAIESGDRPGLFYKVIKNLNDSFVFDNRETIIEKFYELSKKEQPPLLRARELINILAYYNVVDDKNEKVKIIEQEINDIYNEIGFDDTLRNNSYKVLEEYKIYWRELLKNGTEETYL